MFKQVKVTVEAIEEVGVVVIVTAAEVEAVATAAEAAVLVVQEYM